MVPESHEVSAMTGNSLPPGLHVVLGDHAAETFRQAFDPGDRLLVDQDVLSVGPTRACDIEAWKRMRHAYWDQLVPSLMHARASAPLALLDHLDRLGAAERITIWCATSVSEQLFAAHVIHRAIAAGSDAGRIWRVPFESLPGRSARVLGIGELNPRQLAAHPAPVPLSRELLTIYQDAWAALCSDDPTLLAQFAASHPGAGAPLLNAMRCLLRRFPDRRSGLAYWDRRLLEDVRSHGPQGARVIGHTLVENLVDADLVGDWYLFGRMLRLGDSKQPRPLLDISGDVKNMRATDVKLTAFGLDVLEGRAANYPANPIDDYAGGVRLSSREGLLWFTDGERLLRGAA